MKKRLIPVIFMLLLIFGSGEVLGQHPTKYPGTLDIESADFENNHFIFLYHPVDMLSKFSQKLKIQLEMDQMIKNQRWSGPRPILNLGSVPEVLLKYQPDTVLQWGYTFRDLFLLLRLCIRVEDFNPLHLKPRQEDYSPFDLNLNFNFLIDFWFK